MRRALRNKELLWEQILEGYGTCAGLSAEDIAEGLGYSVRTIQQELRSRHIFPKQGRYDIPDFDEYERMEAARGEPAPEEEARLREAEDEEPEDLEDEEEPEEHTFDDCLPEATELMAPFLDAIDEIAQDEDAKRGQEAVTTTLFDLATKEDGGTRGHGHKIAVASLWQAVTLRYDRRHEEDGMVLPSYTYQEMVGKLWNQPWLERSKVAMSIYLAADLPDRYFDLEKMRDKEGDKLPPEIREVIDATLARLAFYRERAMARWRAEQAAEQRMGQRKNQ